MKYWKKFYLKVQFNLLNSSAYYRYLSRRIGAIVETTLSALKYHARIQSLCQNILRQVLEGNQEQMTN